MLDRENKKEETNQIGYEFCEFDLLAQASLLILLFFHRPQHLFLFYIFIVLLFSLFLLLNYFYYCFIILLLIVLNSYIPQFMIAQLIFTLLPLSFASLSQWAYLGGTPVVHLFILILLTSPSLFMYSSIQEIMPVIYILLIGASFYHIVKDIRKMKIATNKYQMNYDLIAIALPVAASGVLFGALMINLLSDLIIVIAQLILLIYLLIFGFKDSPKPISEDSQTGNLGSSPTKPFLRDQVLPLQQQMTDVKNSRFRKVDPAQEQKNEELKIIEQEENNRLSKSKIKVAAFVLLYTIIIVLTKHISIIDLIVVNPELDIPDNFSIQPSNTTSQFQLNQEQKRNVNPNNFLENLVKEGQAGQAGQRVDYDSFTQSDTSCVVGNFLFIIIHMTLSYLSSKSVCIQISAKEADKQKYGFVFLRQIDKMSSKKMWNFMLSGFFSGFFISLFGIGSSIIIVPVWIEFGVEQQDALITSTAVTFFCSLISLIVSKFSQGLPINLLAIIILLTISFSSSALVDYGMKKYVPKSDVKTVRNKIRKILYISSITGLVCYGGFAYFFNKYFRSFGSFC